MAIPKGVLTQLFKNVTQYAVIFQISVWQIWNKLPKTLQQRRRHCQSSSVD